MPDIITSYLEEITQQFYSGHAVEHAYRPALQRLMESFDDTIAVNDPRHSEHGAPDFVFLKKSSIKIIKGYAEAKDITVSLDKTEKTNQMERYAGYANLFLTDYLEFRFFKNGEKYKSITLGHVEEGELYKTPENAEQLIRELQAFLELPPERIRSGKRLAQIMGAKARRIRDNVTIYLAQDDERNIELEKIYEMMKKLLVHDLEPENFADMYAQTLVYGLFVARYSDDTPASFTRSEARDLVPKSNPFLRHFFDHIVGTSFDTRLAYIVDELCEIFSASDVRDIVHKHLRIQDEMSDAKDPIIHFYEDFLQAYDPAERKRMGAYYTPIPVVQFIIRHVDKILKEEFGITKGLGSIETIAQEVATQPWRKKGERKDRLTRTITIPKVQILDPAVGTATFLNETIKFIYQSFKNQEGRWSRYVQDNLVKRLYGFELMMAPYTIAHLKLGMTLRETGVEQLNDRLNIFLTNTLEEGVPQQPDLFSFGLAEAVSEESRLAAEVKSEKPVMVVVGNPPYSGVSSNETKYANSLIDKYKVEPGGKQKLQERKHWLNDDYVKFIAFAEDMIERNGSGIIGMITNNGYLDNPTFRGMRWHLAKTFDKIYVLDLHGNAKKKEVAPDGSKDENVFDIMQGVSIILGLKNGNKHAELAEVYHAEFYGSRNSKFLKLASIPPWQRISLGSSDKLYFSQKNIDGQKDYEIGVSLNDLFKINVAGIVTARDDIVIDENPDNLIQRIERFSDPKYTDFDMRKWLFPTRHDGKYLAGDTRGWKLHNARIKIHKNAHDDFVKEISYRPFDKRYVYYSSDMVDWGREKVMRNFTFPNLGLIFERSVTDEVFVVDSIIEHAYLGTAGFAGNTVPLYIYHEDGSRTPNFDTAKLSVLTQNLTIQHTSEDILDYIYAALHSPSYRVKYKEFLKIEFPRVPVIESNAEFTRFVKLGHDLRQLHLMKSSVINDYNTTFPEQGDNLIEKVSYSKDKVSINDTQYFGNVPEVAWNFYIGGYQPARKWLKDRKGHNLSSDDLDHYQKIIKILIESDRIMKEIDEK